MVNSIRERVRRKWSEEGIDPLVAMAEGVMLDPDVLTIGFARRMTQYKRDDLILHDLDRLEKIVNNVARPIQIIFAGKAHPSDNPGKKILQNIFKTAQHPRFCGRIAFVEDYGEAVAKYLIHGVDVWLNNPLIPMEASGTSGIKASLNGTLNLPHGWIAMMKEAIITISPKFSARRMMKEYLEKFYIPASKALQKEDHSKLAKNDQ
jgi:starch phosphorylase